MILIVLLQLIIQGELQDLEWRATSKWTNEYLESNAVRHSTAEWLQLDSTFDFCSIMAVCCAPMSCNRVKRCTSQGASKVLVEQKLSSSADFGKGRKVKMTFGQLVHQLHEGNDSLYLTTQEVSLTTSPCTQRCIQSVTTAAAATDTAAAAAAEAALHR